MPRNSILDPQHNIDFYTGVVGIYYQPYVSKPAYVFLVTEHLTESDTICFCRYDLHVDEKAQGGKLAFEIEANARVANWDTNSARKDLSTILKGKETKGKCWQIHNDKVSRLDWKIRNLNEHPDENAYHSKDDNCLTWALDMLKDIRIPENELPRKLSDLTETMPNMMQLIFAAELYGPQDYSTHSSFFCGFGTRGQKIELMRLKECSNTKVALRSLGFIVVKEIFTSVYTKLESKRSFFSIGVLDKLVGINTVLDKWGADILTKKSMADIDFGAGIQKLIRALNRQRNPFFCFFSKSRMAVSCEDFLMALLNSKVASLDNVDGNICLKFNSDRLQTSILLNNIRIENISHALAQAARIKAELPPEGIVLQKNHKS